jgi:hypothetical protein
MAVAIHKRPTSGLVTNASEAAAGAAEPRKER